MAMTKTTEQVEMLLKAAEYIRNETIIDGLRANYLDCTTKAIKGYISSIGERPARIEELKALGKQKGVMMQERILERDKKDLTELTDQLHTWLLDYKINHPNVEIALYEIA